MCAMRKKPLRVFLALALLIGLIGCSSMNRAQTGSLIGAGLGATIGSHANGGENQWENAGLGALIGATLGYMIGNEMDKADQAQIAQSLNSGQTRSWRNTQSGNSYTVSPGTLYQTPQGQLYRDVQINGTIDGQREVINAKAYRNPDGSWQLKQ
jgi:surface antigen